MNTLYKQPTQLHTQDWSNVASTFNPNLSKELDTNQRMEVIRDQLEKASIIDNKINFVTGEMLYEVHENMYYAQWGYNTFDEYVAGELEYDLAKAKLLMDIYKVFVVQHGDKVDLNRIRQIPWCRASATRGFLKQNPEKFEEVLHQMETKSVRDLREWVRDQRGQEPKQNMKVVLNFNDPGDYQLWCDVKAMITDDMNRKGENVDDREIARHLMADFNCGRLAKSGIESATDRLERQVILMAQCFGKENVKQVVDMKLS